MTVGGCLRFGGARLFLLSQILIMLLYAGGGYVAKHVMNAASENLVPLALEKLMNAVSLKASAKRYVW